MADFARSGISAGLDIGGTKALAVAVDPTGTPLATVRSRTGSGDSAAVLRTATDVLRRLAGRAGIRPDEFDVVGVGIAGLVHHVDGSVRHAVNLGLGPVALPLGPELADVLDSEVFVENDVNAAALGTAAHLGPDVRDLAFLSIGTGVAAGLLLDGRIRRGATGMAGEIGHLVVEPGGPRCVCGQSGCLEAVASGGAIARRWPGDGHVSPSAHLFAAAAAGDPAAIELRDRTAGYWADAVRLLVFSVDPQRIVLGGGVAEIGEPLLVHVRRALTARAAVAPFLQSLALDQLVSLVPTGVPVGAIGAALAARQRQLDRAGTASSPR